MSIRDANEGSELPKGAGETGGGKANGMTVSINNVHLEFPLPADSGKIFASLPEWIVEDMADFTLFSLQ